MTKKMFAACLLLCLLVPLCAPALAQKTSTAQALFEQYPDVGFTLPADPAAEPLLALVNRDQALSDQYRPKLKTPKVEKKRGADVDLQPEAAAALEAMFLAAKTEGLELVAVSGYRSYGKQKTIYTRSVERNGQQKADRMSARPGASEHQLGLAMDLSCASLDHDLTSKFARKPEGKWVAEHCAAFGFVLRYKAEWTDATGYQGEPWHIRYVGQQHAELMTRLDVPLETYLAYLSLVWQKQNTQP